MTYPEPNSLDDIYGAGAEEAEVFAEALDEAAERATKAGVSYRAIISIITALADAAEKDAMERLPELPDKVLPDDYPENANLGRSVEAPAKNSMGCATSNKPQSFSLRVALPGITNYCEEKIIDGVLYRRYHPEGAWVLPA